MGGGREAELIEEHLAQRFAALREDAARLEARIDARITTNSARIAALETWQNQMIGAGKISRILWLVLVAFGATLWQAALWLATHWHEATMGGH
jgi:deferrochelatase/peroxidase EfeB